MLAVETSTLAGGVALVEDDRTVGEYLLDVRLTHSERLMSAIDRLMLDAGWQAGDLQGLAVAVGPGSFTGLRIGISTVKGLALALALPVAAVPTLDAMAAGLPFAALPVCPVLVARRDEVYCSLYRWSGTAMEREWDYLALSPAELVERLREPVAILGDYPAPIDSAHARPVPPWRRGPSAACVGHLGRRHLLAGEAVGAADLLPLYVRPSAAELKRRVAPVA